MDKIYFVLKEDENEVHTESLWAEKTSSSNYEIRNVPFFIKGISFGDIISVKKQEEKLYFDKIIKKSGFSTYRIILLDPISLERFREYWVPLEKIGCTYEKGKNNLFAIDVPSKTNIYETYSLLENGYNNGVWDFEEGDCGHTLDT